jgi:hypothetical protein
MMKRIAQLRKELSCPAESYLVNPPEPAVRIKFM